MWRPLYRRGPGHRRRDRDENGGPCTYVEDPWTFDWTGGSHDLEFAFRESWVIARIVVTNDPNYQP